MNKILYERIGKAASYKEVVAILEEYDDNILRDLIDSHPFYATETSPLLDVVRYLSDRGLIKLTTQETADEAASNATTVVAYNLHPYKDSRELLRMGYWPSILVTPYHIYLHATHTDEELEELAELDIHTIEPIDRVIRWEFSPIGIVREEAVANANGLQLSFIAPDMIYKSGRPKTDMSMFRNSNSNVVKKEEIRDSKWQEWKVIAVTRYASGMQRSLFYIEGEKVQQYCGTFYYHEPESTTFLAYKTVLRSFNKTTAIEDLLKELPSSPLTEEARGLLEWMNKYYPDVRRHINGELPHDLRYTTASGISYYDGDLLYASEDNLDQILCKVAASAGYDIVILEAMVGSFQVVTEVLDVRSRHDSFLSLLYTY